LSLNFGQSSQLKCTESETVIPIEVGLIRYRVRNHNESKNDEAMRLQLDLVDEVRATAKQRLAQY